MTTFHFLTCRSTSRQPTYGSHPKRFLLSAIECQQWNYWQRIDLNFRWLFVVATIIDLFPQWPPLTTSWLSVFQPIQKVWGCTQRSIWAEHCDGHPTEVASHSSHLRLTRSHRPIRRALNSIYSQSCTESRVARLTTRTTPRLELALVHSLGLLPNADLASTAKAGRSSFETKVWCSLPNQLFYEQPRLHSFLMDQIVRHDFSERRKWSHGAFNRDIVGLAPVGKLGRVVLLVAKSWCTATLSVGAI